MDAEAAFQKRGKLSSRLSGIFGVSPTVFCNVPPIGFFECLPHFFYNVSPMGVMKVYSTLATSRGCCGPWLQSQWPTTERQLVQAKRQFVEAKRQFVQAKRQFVQGKRQFVQGKRQFVQRNPSHFYEDLSRETPVCARKVPFGLIKI